MKTYKVLLLGVWLAILSFTYVSAANIEVGANKINGLTPILISGPLELGDQDRFLNIALSHETALVIFNSPGGNLVAGLEIGKTIRLRKFSTVVAPGDECISSCALAWLGGNERIVFEPGRIGFHAAYTNTDGVLSESGTGNALLGAYLNQLGMTNLAIRFLTEKPPQELNWLTKDLASFLGIRASYLPYSWQGSEKIAETFPVHMPNVENVPTPIKLSQDANDQTFVILPDRDIYGFDLSPPTGAPNSAICMKQCNENARCMSFTYNEKINRCYLKSGGSRVWWSKGAISGFRKTIGPSLDFFAIMTRASSTIIGHEFARYLNSYPEVCAGLCNQNAKCQGFSFSRKRGGLCILLDGKLRFSNEKGSFAGVKTKNDSSLK